MPVGLGLVFLPYITYLLLNKDVLNKKHYISLFLIGLHSPLTQDIFAFVFLIPIVFILANKTKNFNLYFKVLSVVIISSALTDIHIVIGSIFGPTLHRELFMEGKDFISTFKEAFGNIFFSLNFKKPLFIFEFFLVFLLGLISIISFFKKEKNIRFILFLMIGILFLQAFLGYHYFVDNVFIGFLDIFKGYHFKLERVIPLSFALLFIFQMREIKIKILRKFLFLTLLLSIFFIQIKIPTLAIGQHYLTKNMDEMKIKQIRENLIANNFMEVFQIIFNKENYLSNRQNTKYLTNKTFDNYYKFDDYLFIKDIVKNSRVMSVGLDPMVAVMNDIKVIDGYHNLYPLKYKIKFRKIIADELEKNVTLKRYYDNWGNRVYAFYSDKNDLILNFQYAKKLGADYVISKFPIQNNNLKITCYNCNGSKEIFLYKIL